MAYNQLAKLTDNLAAIQIALDWKPGQVLSYGQRLKLKKYSGFGGIKAILYPNDHISVWEKLGASSEDLRMYHPIMGLHELLKNYLKEEEYLQVYNSIKESVLTSFYTPEIVPEVLFQTLQNAGLEPKAVYEPSAGAGIFISQAMEILSGIEQVTATEKDILTSKILKALFGQTTVPVTVNAMGFEETPESENGKFDLVVSNVPFGNFKVYDRNLEEREYFSKIHNYFFAKGLTKLAEGGILAYIVTNGFLNSPSNQEARKYLLERSDLISVMVMPDNLMKETGNTEAPSHLIVVQKNSQKKEIGSYESFLINTIERKNEFGIYHINHMISMREHDFVLGDEVKPGKNQYGKATEVIWQNGNINDIGKQMAAQLAVRFTNDIDHEAFNNALSRSRLKTGNTRKFTLLPMPEMQTHDSSSMQLGLFDVAPEGNSNRAVDYLNELDLSLVDKMTAKVISIVKTTENPNHECIVLITAKQLKSQRYIYKLYSNVQEIVCSANWVNAAGLKADIDNLSYTLKEFGHNYIHTGDDTLKAQFGIKENEFAVYIGIKPHYQNGMLAIEQGMVGTLSYIDLPGQNARFTPLTNHKDQQYYTDYIDIREKYFELNAPEEQHNEQVLRAELNERYDSFISKYGVLNDHSNRDLLLADKAFGELLRVSLEIKEEGKYVKSDFLLTGLNPSDQYQICHTPADAIARSLNLFGKIDLEYIERIMLLDQSQVIENLEGLIYLNPGNRDWEARDKYLSGNVVKKLRSAKIAVEGNPENVQFKKSLEAIEKVQPLKIPFELIDFNLGERWIPRKYYNSFAKDFFEVETKVEYFPSIDKYKVKFSGQNAKTDQEYSIKTKSGYVMGCGEILENALENTAPYFSYTIEVAGEKIKKPDNEATQLANLKIETIRNDFVNWLKSMSQEEKDALEKLYNDTFNCYRLREYDGSHLTFPNLNKEGLGIKDLYSSQKESVWRTVQNRGALIDHEVGLGKTLTMIVSSQEMKRLGIANKPMILAMKANVNQIKSTFRKAYPNAKILAPDENDYNLQSRFRIFHQIKNNNWDCIILTHDQFGKIPQSDPIMQEIFQEELDNLERDLETLGKLGGEISRSILKGLEIRKQNLTAKLAEITHRISTKQDDGIDFDSMKIDHIFIDESHKFKNLTYTTRHSRVAGLGNSEGSQRALHMLFAIRTLQRRFDSDLCCTFLSGTPISNSLTELYLIFKYLRPNEMKRQGIENFDGWVSVFAKKTTDFEFSVTNEIIAKERFRHFIKVPELALFYNDITDYKTAEHINLDKPKLNEILVNIKPTEDQVEFTKNLIAFARTGNGELIGRGQLSDAEEKAKMLIATNYAKKMAVDMRMISSKYQDHPNNKINVCAKKVAEIYHESSSHKGTQLIFSDIGTPKPYEFNVYDGLKEALVNTYKIPAHHISYIHDWSDKKKPELFTKMNDGRIRILLGSTEKAGTGLNVQRRMVAMHHLDIPWKPSELDQRNGRGARQGNQIIKEHYSNVIPSYIYAVEQSLDNYKFNLLKNKQLFISQMKNSQLYVRSIDEGAMDESTGLNFAEYIAILSGDNSLLEKSKIDRKVAELENLKKAYIQESIGNRYKLEALERTRSFTQATIKDLSEDSMHYASVLQKNKEGVKLNPLKLAGFNNPDAEAIGKYFVKLFRSDMKADSVIKIGTLYGFDLHVRQQKERRRIDQGENDRANANSLYAQRGDKGIKYICTEGSLEEENVKYAARIFLNAIDKCQSLETKYKEELKSLEKDIPMLRNIIEKPFHKEQELKDLKLTAERLAKEIANKIQETQEKQMERVTENPDGIELPDYTAATVPTDTATIKKIMEEYRSTNEPLLLASIPKTEKGHEEKNQLPVVRRLSKMRM